MSVDELKGQGNAAAKAGDFEKAEQCYTQAIAIDSNNHILYSNRSNIYMQQKNYDKAFEDGEKCIALNPAFGKGYVRKADALAAQNKVDEALAILNEGAEKDPNEKMIGERRSQLMESMQGQMQLQVFGRSEEELRVKMTSNPRIQEMMNRDPTLFYRANQARQNSNFMSLLQQDQAMGQVILELMGIGAQFANQPNENGCAGKCGDDCCQKTGGPCCKDQPKPAPAPVPAPQPKEVQPELTPEQKEALECKNRGNDLFKQQNYEEAIVQYKKAFELHKNVTYLNNISSTLLKQEKYEEALKQAEEAYQYGRDNYGSANFQEMAKALSKQGSALHKLNRYEEAIQKLRDSMLEHRDKATLALLNKIEEEFRQHQLKQQFNPEKAAECKNEGNVLVKANKYVEAAEAFTQGIKYLPEKLIDDAARVLNLQLHNNRSLALFKAGQIHASYEDALFVIQNEPTNIKALLRKAQIERIRKQYYLSIESYQKVLKLDQTNAEAVEGYQKTAQKVNEMQSGQMSEQEITEIVNIAMTDPEMQKIAKDPGMAQVIQQIQQNPQASQRYLSDPQVSSKLEKLINSGIIRIGGHKQ